MRLSSLFNRTMVAGVVIFAPSAMSHQHVQSSHSSSERFEHEHSSQSSQESQKSSAQSSKESLLSSQESSAQSAIESAISSEISNISSDESNESSRLDSLESAERSVEDAADKLEFAQINVLKKEMHLKNFNILLDCATALIEDQFNGIESSLLGLSYLSQGLDRIHKKEYAYGDIIRSCEAKRNAYKKGVRKKTIARSFITNYSSNEYLAQVNSLYKKGTKAPLVDVAKAAINASLACKKVIGGRISAGMMLSVTVGYEHYICRTPLGRKYHIFGPSAGLGLGIGLTASASAMDETTFKMPLHSRPVIITSDKAETSSVVAGIGTSRTNNDTKKSDDITIGLGFHDSGRGLIMAKMKGISNFYKSGLYSTLKLPFIK